MIRAFDEYGNVVDLVELEKQIRLTALNEFIGKAKEEMNKVYNWDDDDYFIGMTAGYQYSIEIAMQMKEHNNNKCNNKGAKWG